MCAKAAEAAELQVGGRDSFAYDAFISYAHEDRAIAAGIQKGLHRIGRRMGHLHALRVFRDATDLTASPDLWGKVVEAMDRARYFIIVLSPHAVASGWVNKEVAHWMERRGPDQLLFVVAGGRLAWDEVTGRFDPHRSDVALPVLTEPGVLAAEPLYVDVGEDAPWDPRAPMFREKVTDLAAPIHGKPKYELASEDLREQRRFRRLRRAAIAGLVLLTVLAVVAAAIAFMQRNQAENQARIALSRQLASTSNSLLSTNLRAALQLAVSAYRTDASAQTLSALVRADLATPKLVRYLSADAEITRIEGSGDGKTIVAGLIDGRVVRWDVTLPADPVAVGALGQPITSLAVNADGSVIAATDGARATLWQTGGRSAELAVPSGQVADAVGVSPSGRTVITHGAEPRFSGTRSVTILDVASNAVVVRDDPLRVNDLTDVSTIVVVSDDEVLFFDDAYGGWDRRHIRDWSPIEASSIHLGTRQRPGRPSADGRFLTATNGFPTIPVWATTEPADNGAGSTNQPTNEEAEQLFGAHFSAQAPNSDPPGTLALSSDGTTLAITHQGSIYVTPVAPAGAPRDPAIQLTGAGSVTELTFLGDNRHLLSGAGRNVALWDLDQIDRIAETTTTPLESTCRACGNPGISISPDSRRVVITADPDASSGRTIVQPMPGIDEPGQVVEDFGAIPLWTEDTRGIAVMPERKLGGVPSMLTPVAVGRGNLGRIVAAALAPDGRTVVAVNAKGAVYLLGKDTRELRLVAPGPPELEPESKSLYARDVAINSTADLVAIIKRNDDPMMPGGSVKIIDIASRSPIGNIPGNDVKSVVFTGPRLLVGREKRPLEVWDERGLRLHRTIADVGAHVIGNNAGTMIAESLGHEVKVVDLDSGTLLGVLAAPPLEVPAYQRTSVAFSPNGSRIVTVTNGGFKNEDGLLIERNLTPESLIATACATAGSPLSKDEMNSLIGLTRLEHEPCPAE